MKAAGLAGVSRRRSARTTIRGDRVRPSADLVDRNFYADGPNVLWVADITYVPTWAGFLYLAVVLDAFSRRIVGWAMGTNLKTQLVLDALSAVAHALNTRPRKTLGWHTPAEALDRLLKKDMIEGVATTG